VDGAEVDFLRKVVQHTRARMPVRPQSAPPIFANSGVTARPAGVAGILGTQAKSSFSGDAVSFYYGTNIAKGMKLREHALRRHSQYAVITPAGWTPKEALVQPTAQDFASGAVSAGSIDNTYVAKPLANRWGKARSRAKNEVFVPPRKQATDLLIAAKGATDPPPAQGLSDMLSVRPLYSKTIPLFHPIDPQRQESGFIRSPNIIPGALPAPQSALLGIGPTPTIPADHKLRKLAYDRSNYGKGSVPVTKVVYASLPRPKTAAPVFFSRAAGLPGGLSLIEAA
jgi:hypothetical protein